MGRAKERLSSGKNLIYKKSKHINLADRENLGWQVVKFYESDDLATDSEDEKHINRAKRKATAAFKKREAKRNERKKPFIGILPTPILRNHSNRGFSAPTSSGEGCPSFVMDVIARDTPENTVLLLWTNSRNRIKNCILNCFSDFWFGYIYFIFPFLFGWFLHIRFVILYDRHRYIPLFRKSGKENITHTLFVCFPFLDRYWESDEDTAYFNIAGRLKEHISF